MNRREIMEMIYEERSMCKVFFGSNRMQILMHATPLAP